MQCLYDSANPQNGFKVFLFDTSGNGVAGTVDFTVRGVLMADFWNLQKVQALLLMD